MPPRSRPLGARQLPSSFTSSVTSFSSAATDAPSPASPGSSKSKSSSADPSPTRRNRSSTLKGPRTHSFNHRPSVALSIGSKFQESDHIGLGDPLNNGVSTKSTPHDPPLPIRSFYSIENSENTDPHASSPYPFLSKEPKLDHSPTRSRHELKSIPPNTDQSQLVSRVPTTASSHNFNVNESTGPRIRSSFASSSERFPSPDSYMLHSSSTTLQLKHMPENSLEKVNTTDTQHPAASLARIATSKNHSPSDRKPVHLTTINTSINVHDRGNQKNVIDNESLSATSTATRITHSSSSPLIQSPQSPHSSFPNTNVVLHRSVSQSSHRSLAAVSPAPSTIPTFIPISETSIDEPTAHNNDSVVVVKSRNVTSSSILSTDSKDSASSHSSADSIGSHFTHRSNSTISTVSSLACDPVRPVLLESKNDTRSSLMEPVTESLESRSTPVQNFTSINDELNTSITESIFSISSPLNTLPTTTAVNIDLQSGTSGAISVDDSERNPILQDESIEALHREFLNTVKVVEPLHIGKKKNGQADEFKKTEEILIQKGKDYSLPFTKSSHKHQAPKLEDSQSQLSSDAVAHRHKIQSLGIQQDHQDHSPTETALEIGIPGSLVPTFFPPSENSNPNKVSTTGSSKADHLQFSYYESEYDFLADRSTMNNTIASAMKRSSMKSTMRSTFLRTSAAQQLEQFRRSNLRNVNFDSIDDLEDIVKANKQLEKNVRGLENGGTCKTLPVTLEDLNKPKTKNVEEKGNAHTVDNKQESTSLVLTAPSQQENSNIVQTSSANIKNPQELEIAQESNNITIIVDSQAIEQTAPTTEQLSSEKSPSSPQLETVNTALINDQETDNIESLETSPVRVENDSIKDLSHPVSSYSPLTPDQEEWSQAPPGSFLYASPSTASSCATLTATSNLTPKTTGKPKKSRISLGPIPNWGPELATNEIYPETDFASYFGIVSYPSPFLPGEPEISGFPVDSHTKSASTQQHVNTCGSILFQNQNKHEHIVVSGSHSSHQQLNSPTTVQSNNSPIQVSSPTNSCSNSHNENMELTPANSSYRQSPPAGGPVHIPRQNHHSSVPNRSPLAMTGQSSRPILPQAPIKPSDSPVSESSNDSSVGISHRQSVRRPLPTPSTQSLRSSYLKNAIAPGSNTSVYSPQSQRHPSSVSSNNEVRSHRSPLPSLPQANASSSSQRFKHGSSNVTSRCVTDGSAASSRSSSTSSVNSFASAYTSAPSVYEGYIPGETASSAGSYNVYPQNQNAPHTPAHTSAHSHHRSNSHNSSSPGNDSMEADISSEYLQVSCSVCRLPIHSNERVVRTSAMTTLHLSCFRCHKCHMSLEHSQFYVHDTDCFAPKHIPQQQQHSGPLGFLYCHLDYHELFSPRCGYCNTPVEGSAIFALDKHWHDSHFFCGSCNKPFEKGQDYCVVNPSQAISDSKKLGNSQRTPSTSGNHNSTVAWCTDCYSKKTAISCWKCSKSMPQNEAEHSEPCIEALGRTWCSRCFACEECDTPFETTEFILREDGTLVCFSCEAKRIRSDVWK